MGNLTGRAQPGGWERPCTGRFRSDKRLYRPWFSLHGFPWARSNLFRAESLHRINASGAPRWQEGGSDRGSQQEASHNHDYR
jgi:hypothetical protein